MTDLNEVITTARGMIERKEFQEAADYLRAVLLAPGQTNESRGPLLRSVLTGMPDAFADFLEEWTPQSSRTCLTRFEPVCWSEDGRRITWDEAKKTFQ